MVLDISVKSGIMLVTKNDGGVTIGCEMTVLKCGYKKIDILSFGNFYLILNKKRTDQSSNIFSQVI